MRQLVFLIGLALFVWQLRKDAVWLTMGGVYVYFAIPSREFYAPNAPYQAAFFAGAVLMSLTYYLRFDDWTRGYLRRRCREAVQGALASVSEAAEAAFLKRAPKAASAGDLAVSVGAEIAAPLSAHIRANCPSRLSLVVQDAAQRTVDAAALEAATHAMGVRERFAKDSEVQLRRALSAQSAPLYAAAVDRLAAQTAEAAMDQLLFDEKSHQRASGGGPLGMPEYFGPIEGILTNWGLWMHLAFALYTLWAVENAVFSSHIGQNRIEITWLLYIPLLGIVAGVRTVHHFIRFAYAWMFGTWHLAMNGVTLWIREGGRADDIGGQGGEANFLGGVVVSTAPIAFGLTLAYKHRWARMLMLGVAGCYTLAILASGSRAGMLAFAGGLGYWLLNTRRRQLAVGLLCLATAGFLFVAPTTFWEKMGTILATKGKNPWVRNPIEPSKNERLELWKLAIKIFKTHPMTGVGPNNYMVVSAEELPFTDAYEGKRGLQAHNTWLQLFAEYGILGGAIWAGSFFLAILAFFLARRRIRRYPELEVFEAVLLGLEAGMLSTFVVYFFNSFMWYDYAYWQMVSGPLALVIAYQAAARLDHLQTAPALPPQPAPARYGPPRYSDLQLSARPYAPPNSEPRGLWSA